MLLVACAAALPAAPATPAAAAGPCSGAAFYVAAHEDDTLLFQSPRLLEDVRADRCVRTVFTTAGDAGNVGSEGKYWKGREAGAEAAYAEMAGVEDRWTDATETVDGHAIGLATLDAQPGISIAYLRLPDGNPNGTGFPSTGEQTLTKLWRGGHGETPAISSIDPVDGSPAYTYVGLVETLAALIEEFGAREIVTQNYEGPLLGTDHSDHVATGRFVRAAQLEYREPHLLLGFRGYDVFAPPSVELAANVSGALLTAKRAAFLAYTSHDEACGTSEDCGAAPYPEWLERQYVAATESTPGADAGPPQTVLVGSSVRLDGAASFDPGGGGLGYEWTQTSGPPVTLSSSTAERPTFAAPATPATLGFSLVVDNGVRESLPAGVTVAVVALPPDEIPAGDGGGSGPPPAPGPRRNVEIELSRTMLRFVVGRRSSQRVRVVAPGKRAVTCRGQLPSGARCRVTASRDLVISSSKSVRRAGTYHLVVRVMSADGAFLRPLTVVFSRR